MPAITQKKVVSQAKRGTGPVGKGFTGKTGTSISQRKVAAHEDDPAVKGLQDFAAPKGFAEGITTPTEEAAALAETERLSQITAGVPDAEAKTTGLADTKEFATLEEFQAGIPKGKGQVSAVERAIGAKQGTGGFVFHEPGKGGQPRPTFKSGLPTDRLPTFSELGGAIGSVFKFVSDLSKFNRARGLVPGTDAAKSKSALDSGSSLEKAKLSALTKLHEAAIISGDTTEAARRKAQIDANYSWW